MSAFSDELFAAARPIWEAQLEHPFVQGIAAGDLDEDVFRRWVVQDYLYLKEFARVFAWAAAKADRLASMGWYAAALDLTLNTEMELHRTYAARFGISARDLEAGGMWPTTRAYTDFLVRTAADGDLAELVAALLPCAWGYAWLGGRLAEQDRPPDRRYADWIEQYASTEFQQAAGWLRDEMDRLAADAPAGRRERLRDLFLLSSRYEWMFWEMCWRGEEWPD
ncbi:MAG TPA: thiaminase II [Gemmatimonadota bacterium]|nr:thiaminase II [Gemmatimonadota bacterium]